MLSFCRRLRRQPPETVVAYLDESFDETVFALAGFAAPPDEWERFSIAWTAALATPPAISALKTNDAMRLDGEFQDWTDADRDAKLCSLYAVIDNHVSFGLSAVIPMSLLKEIDDPRLSKEARNPYFYAVSQIIGDAARYQYQNLADFQVNFVFDEKTEQKRLLSVWDAIVTDAPADVKPGLGAAPTWARDDTTLPLQAADLEAWWLRRRWIEKIKGLGRLEYPWTPGDIPELACVHTEETIAELNERMLKSIHDLETLTQLMKDPPKF